MSTYSSWTDKDLLAAFTEGLMNTFTDTPGTDDERWRAVANAAIDDLGRSELGLEVHKRKRKWNEPNPTLAHGTLPDAVPIANPDRLAIVQGTTPNYTYQNA